MVKEQSPVSFSSPWAIHIEGCARNLSRKKGGGKIEKWPERALMKQLLPHRENVT